jgi:hypothetical protein
VNSQSFSASEDLCASSSLLFNSLFGLADSRRFESKDLLGDSSVFDIETLMGDSVQFGMTKMGFANSLLAVSLHMPASGHFPASENVLRESDSLMSSRSLTSNSVGTQADQGLGTTGTAVWNQGVIFGIVFGILGVLAGVAVLTLFLVGPPKCSEPEESENEAEMDPEPRLRTSAEDGHFNDNYDNPLSGEAGSHLSDDVFNFAGEKGRFE